MTVNMLSALFAMNRYTYNSLMMAKSAKRIASGYKINSASDNAAGLAVSEKMRSQINGLKVAKNNTLDTINLLQVAEGGLNETHAILQRMREIALQSANGTYQDDTDREALSIEYNELKKEIDRISGSTEFNKIKLLGGTSSSGSSSSGVSSYYSGVFSQYGPNYSSITDATSTLNTNIAVASNIADAKINFTTGASGTGAEYAIYNADGELEIGLCEGQTYTDAQVNNLIKGAFQSKGATVASPKFAFQSEAGRITVKGEQTTAQTESGERQSMTIDLTDGGSGYVGLSDTISFKANSYGSSDVERNGLAAQISITTSADAGSESVKVTKGAAGDEVEIFLATGKDYSESDIKNMLKEKGYDYEVKFSSANAPESSPKKIALTDTNVTLVSDDTLDGKGVGKAWFPDFGSSTGNFIGTLTFQIGPNASPENQMETELSDMSCAGIGIASSDVNTQKNALTAVDELDAAIKTVSLKRAYFGAQASRLEYTYNNLSTYQENLIDAESRIRDTDIAEEMINYTKYSILAQAAQAIMAQQVQSASWVLKLLQ